MNKEKNENDSDIFNHELGLIDNYTVSRRIGRGKYSNVFSGKKITNEKVVVKVLKPVRIPKINREINILKQLKGGPNISQLLDVVQDPDSGSISLIMNYSINNEVKKLSGIMNIDDIAIYIYKVLQAVDYAHQIGIMHRDIKPGNIIWCQSTKEVCLIDWGLAEFFNPGQEYIVRVATKHYKGPELLLNYKKYEPSLDIWCLGCTLASLLFFKYPFFKGRDNDEQIEKMCEILGGQDMINYIDKYEIDVNSKLIDKIKKLKKNLWSSFINEKNSNLINEEVLDLLTKMLTIDHKLRPTPKEAMNHPFFNRIKHLIN